MSDVRTFQPNEASSTYSHMGKDFGNPMMNMMMSMAFGQNLMPSRDDGQSMYDSLIQRQRSQHFMQLQRSGGANNMLFKAMGVNNNPMARSMSTMAMSSPDSAMGKLMSPLLGGNPMAASMQLYGGMSGANVMGNFGRQGDISVGETEDTMSSLMNNLYKTQDYEGQGGVREELNQKTQKRLLGLAGDKKNDDYLKNLGINVERDSSGGLTEQSRKKLENFEIAGSSEDGKQAKQAREEKVSALNSDLGSLLSTSDKDMSAALDDRVEKQLKAHGIATADQIKAAKHSGDKATYASKIREYLDKYEVSGGDAGTPEAKQARKDIVTSLKPELKNLAEAQQTVDKKDTKEPPGEQEILPEAAESFEKKLVSQGIATQEQVNTARQGGAASYTTQLQGMLAQYEAPEGDVSPQEAKQARKDRVASLKPELQGLTGTREILPEAAESFEKKLVSQGIATQEQVNTARQGGAASYTTQLQGMLAQYEAPEGDVSPQEAKQARKDRVASLKPELQGVTSVKQTQTPPPGNKIQEASDRLETKLRESGALTPTQIKEIKTDGKIDAEKATKALKKYEEAPQETEPAEKPETTQLRNNIASKRTRASKLTNDLEEIQKLDDKDETKGDKIKTFKKSLQEDLKLEGEDVDKIFDEDRGILKTKGVSSKGAARAKRAIKDFTKLDETEQAYEEGQQAKDAGKKYKGFNFENSRGFKAEDFTSAYVQASNLRGLGESRGVSVAGKMDDFSKNAGGALSAARSLYGNKSGGELVGKISDMMGDDFDLASVPGNDKAEKLLRDVKATADVAGVSINTMLGIIDATKELAANNPRLSTVSAQTTTKMAVNAVAKAGDIGSAMSAKDYRQAGGTQGIASDEVASQQAYLESGIGQQIAAVASVTKGLGTMTDENGQTYDPHQKYLEMVKNGELTAHSFASGEAQAKISKITQGKIDADMVARLGTDPSAAKLGLADNATSETLAAAKDKAVANDFWEDMSLGSGGKFSKEEYEKRVTEEKAKGKDGKSRKEIFDSMRVHIAGNTELGREADVYGGSAIRQSVDEARSPAERARFEKRRAERATTDARIDKTKAANQSPVAQQFLDALMQGKDFEGTADLVGGIFATSDGEYKNQGNKEAVDKAKTATEKISKISAKAEGSQSEILKLGMGKALNEFIGGRKAEAAERGEEKQTAYLRTDITDAEFKAEAENLKNVQGTDTAEQANRTLRDLENQGNKLTDPMLIKSREALRTAKAAGHLDSDESLKLAKSGTLEGVAAATVKSQQVANMQRTVKEEKTASLKGLGETLNAADENDPDNKHISEAKDFYAKQLGVEATDPAVIEKMFKDYSNPTQGAKGKNFFKDEKTGARRTDLDGSSLQDALSATQNDISAAEGRLKEPSATGGDSVNKPLIDGMKDLLAGIKNGGGIGEALGRIATILSGIK